MPDQRGRRRIHLSKLYTFSCGRSSSQTEDSVPIGGPGFSRIIYCNEPEKHEEKPYRPNYVSNTIPAPRTSYSIKPSNMFGLGSRSRRTTHTTTRTSKQRRGLFHRASPNRRAAGYKAALSNPNTTHEGRKHAKHELKRMGRGREAHVSLGTRIKRTLGIRSTPRRQRY